MNTRVRRSLTVVLLLAGLAALPACGEPNEDEDRLKAALRRTDRLAFRFVYEDKRTELPGFLSDAGVTDAGDAAKAAFDEASVQGVIEDDFRFKARVAIDGSPTFEKVISDDALAMRFLDPGKLPDFIDREAVGTVETDTDIPNVSVLDALRSQRWVLDQAGAPSVLAATNADRSLGVDPVSDALTVFDYVLGAIDEAFSVQKYSKDALDPAYRTTEDPFPKPDENSGVIRYDLRRPKLPAVGSVGASGRADVPATKHFRKLAVYVKDGRVIQIIERIELTGKAVGEFVDYNRAFLREQGLTKDEIAEFDKELKEIPEKLLGTIMLGTLSINLKRFGGEEIPMRAMNLDLQDLAEENKVDLPTENVVKGNLAVLIGSGRKPVVAEGTGTTTTSTTAPIGAEPAGTPPTSSP